MTDKLKTVAKITIAPDDMYYAMSVLLSLLIDIRDEARVHKDYVTADKIRDTLKKFGATFNDDKKNS